MWKAILKMTDSYKALPHDVQNFSIETVGSNRYIYAHFSDRNKVTIGRYKTRAEARQVLETILRITNSSN